MKYIKKYEELEDKSKITKLYLSNKGLNELPDLSEYVNLKYLYCHNNQLTSLPELPKSLEILYCHNNNLPYNDLGEYKEWYAKTYPERIDAEKYNL